MKTLFTIVMGCCILGWGSTQLQAQNGPVTSGGEAFGSSGLINYSIGQFDYQYIFGSTGEINAGLQQPYEILFVTGIKEETLFKVNLYPNPVADLLSLDTENPEKEDLSFTLTDVNGKKLLEQKIEDPKTIIPMYDNANGIYFMTISSGIDQIKTYKIIKNK